MGKLKIPGTKHLLAGNGFNKSFGINTDYENIYHAMAEEWPQYKDIKEIFERDDYKYDIEKVIDHLEKNLDLERPNSKEKKFTREYINEKMRIDFLIGLYKVLDKEKSRIYDRNKKEGIRNFMGFFKTYFTLNFDPLLYLILMRYQNDNQKIKSYQQGLLWDDESTPKHLQKMEEAFDKVKAIFDQTELLSGNMSKNTFINCVIDIIQRDEAFKFWPEASIKEAVRRVFDQKYNDGESADSKSSNKQVNPPPIPFFDGFIDEINGQFFFDPAFEKQNLFFLHGAMHIVTAAMGDKRLAKKITRNKSGETFYSYLNEVIHYEGQSITSILSGNSADKKARIMDDKSKYLSKCYAELGKLSGKVVIFGCSFHENDTHIYEQINKSNIDTFYISTCRKELEKDFDGKVHHYFPNKNIEFFDYDDFSYLSNQTNTTLFSQNL